MFLIIGVCVTLGLLTLLGYFYLPQPPVKIEVKYQSDLVVVGKNVPQIPQTQSGFCGPRGCGPNTAIPREEVGLDLSAQQLTALVNSQKPPEVLLTNIRVGFRDEAIVLTGISFYPQLLGNIAVVAALPNDPQLLSFKIIEIYQGNKKLPDNAAQTVSVNGDAIVEKMLAKYDIWPTVLEIRDDKLHLEANIPEGLIKVENGTVKLFQ